MLCSGLCPGLPGNLEGGGTLAAGVLRRYKHAEPGPVSAKPEVKLGSFYSKLHSCFLPGATCV